MPYKLYYLPSAQQDILDVVRYICVTLQNPEAARRMVKRFTEAAENACSMPYACPVYIPVRPLKYEYRKMIVGNYLIFYRVDELAGAVIVSRVIYGKRRVERLLD